MTELVTPQAKCDTSDRVTNSLLGYGVIAGPVYVVVSLAQAFTRDGFDLSRHQWSLLANGTGGWIQVTNFIATGLMLIAMAVGVRRAVGHGLGVQVGTAPDRRLRAEPDHRRRLQGGPRTWFPRRHPRRRRLRSPSSGLIHFAAAGIGFTCVAAACFVLARRYAAEGRKGWASVLSWATGVVVPGGLRLRRLRWRQCRGEPAVHRRRAPGLHLDHSRFPGSLTVRRPRPATGAPTEPLRSNKQHP